MAAKWPRRVASVRSIRYEWQIHYEGPHAGSWSALSESEAGEWEETVSYVEKEQAPKSTSFLLL
jgi:hypothetical protein